MQQYYIYFVLMIISPHVIYIYIQQMLLSKATYT